jgi:hypothetical protein
MGEGVVALACLDASDSRAIHDAIPDALRDAGVDPLTEIAAAARLAFAHIAQMQLDGKGNWRWVLSSVHGTFEQNDWAIELYDEPLGSLFGLDDEVSGGWGRSEADIAVVVQTPPPVDVLSDPIGISTPRAAWPGGGRVLRACGYGQSWVPQLHWVHPLSARDPFSTSHCPWP